MIRTWRRELKDKEENKKKTNEECGVVFWKQKKLNYLVKKDQKRKEMKNKS